MALRLTARGRRTLVAVVTITAVLTFLVGAGFLAYPLYTDYRAGETQRELAEAFRSNVMKLAYQSSELPMQSPLTRLRIPKLGVDTIVVEGVSKKALDTGAGHYPTTPLPGEPGNVAIAGHRNTFGKPFADLDRLQQGDKVILETPIGTHTYEMVPAFDNHPNPWVVEPSDLTVLNPTSEPYLTLTTCHPRGSAKQRLIARLALVESVSRSVDGAA